MHIRRVQLKLSVNALRFGLKVEDFTNLRHLTVTILEGYAQRSRAQCVRLITVILVPRVRDPSGQHKGNLGLWRGQK